MLSKHVSQLDATMIRFLVEVSAVIQKFFAYNSHLSKLILNNSCWTLMEVFMFYVIKQYAGNNGLWIQKTYQIIAFLEKKIYSQTAIIVKY